VSPGAGDPILQVEDLTTCFFTGSGTVRAVDGVSFDVRRGETLAIVGESGCGKSVTALSLLKLVPDPGKIVGGRVLFDQRDIVAMSEEEVRELRGN